MKTKFQNLKEQVEKACSKLKQAITELPDAEDGVTMVGKNCFTISLSTIAKHKGILDPSYYLSIETKKALIEAIESKRNPESIINFITKALSESSFIHNGSKIIISPKVAEKLKQVWEQ